MLLSLKKHHQAGEEIQFLLISGFFHHCSYPLIFFPHPLLFLHIYLACSRSVFVPFFTKSFLALLDAA